MATATKKKQGEDLKLVTLTNKQRRMVPYNLAGEHMRDHPEYGYKRISQTRTTHNPRTGVVGSVRGRASVPDSITFCAREKKENLPKALIRCPDIAAAIKRGDLRIVYQDAPVGEEKKVDAEGDPRKTALQLQAEQEENKNKAEAKHRESDLFKDAIAAHAKRPKRSKKPTGQQPPRQRQPESTGD